MQLVIDIGNTRLKTAVFKDREIIQNDVFENSAAALGAGLFDQYKIQHIIVCSVVNEITDFLDALSQKATVLLFKADTPIPLSNQYQSKSTLGSDRLAAAVGAYSLYPNQNVLVIDAGTCIKYNFSNAQNEYLGGAISPGLKMRFNALHKDTARLPQLHLNLDYKQYLGTNTDESILSGVQTATLHEVEGFINQYKADYDNLTVLLTGGDANFFEKRLKKPIFADNLLLLKGLNEILLYNLKTA